MKKIGLLFFFFLTPFYLFGQTDCEVIYKNAEKLFKSSNYQTAIKKLTAYKVCANSRQQRKADSLLIKIYETVDKQRIEAIKSKELAEKNEKRAKQQEQIAIEQRNKAQANYLISEAKSIVETDPTIALRLAEEAMKKSNDSSIYRAALKIYNNNSFYKIIKKNTEIKSHPIVQTSSGGIVVLENLNEVVFYNIYGDLIKSIEKKQFSYNVNNLTDWLIIVDNFTGKVEIMDINGKIIGSGKIIIDSFDSIQNMFVSPSMEYVVIKYLKNPKAEIIFIKKGEKKTLNTFPVSFFTTGVIFSKYGDYFILPGLDLITVYDKNGDIINIFDSSMININQYSLSEDGKYLLSWNDKILKLFEIDEDTVDPILEESYEKQIRDAFFHEDKIVINYYHEKVSIIDYDGFIVSDFKGSNFILNRECMCFMEILKGKAFIKDLSGNTQDEFSNNINSIKYLTHQKKFITNSSTHNSLKIWSPKFNFYYRNLKSEFEHERVYGNSIFFKNNLEIIIAPNSYSQLDITKEQAKHFSTNGTLLEKNKKSKDSLQKENYEIRVSNPQKIKIYEQAQNLISIYNLKGDLWTSFNTLHKNVSFTKDGLFIIIHSGNRIAIFDLQKQLNYTIELDDSIYQIKISEKDNDFIVKTNNAIRVFTIFGKLKKIINSTGRINIVSFSNNGKIILTKDSSIHDLYYESILTVIDSVTGTVIKKIKIPIADRYNYEDMYLSWDGNFVYWIEDNVLKEYNLTNDSILEIVNRNYIDFVRFNFDGTIEMYSNNEEKTIVEKRMSLNEFLKSNNLQPLSKEQRTQYNIE